MAEIDLTELLRPGLLDGVSIALARAGEAGIAPGSAASVAGAACSELGAIVHELPLTCTGQPEADDAALDAALAAAPAGGTGTRMLLVDAGGLFVRSAQDALIATLEASWRVTRAVANAAFIPDEAGGRIVYLAPPAPTPTQAPSTQASGGETHADAARAGLENLARTLSIEWARYGIRPVAIAPGPRTTPEQIAGVVAYLASPAGDYFSGCQLDLRGTSPGV
jgi:NAD(P)-dependent dehydrogenase (short-subunit alcohol dehydrogenase family)